MPELKYVWCLNNKHSELSEYKDVLVVKYKMLKWLYNILTARIIITNVALRPFLPYRKNQIILNTWHGGGAYKKVGIAINFSDKVKGYWHRKIFPLLSQCIIYCISSCKVFSDVMHESYCIAYNKFLPIGMPRNDIFFGNNKDFIIEVKNKLGIPLDYGIVLYAPTFRGSGHLLEMKSVMELDIEKLKTALREKFKKEFVCLFKGHPSFFDDLYCVGTINVSSYNNDMQELLLIADVLITDYSSCTWDFSLSSKPCFLFTPDLDLYLAHDRGFYIPIEQWPYPLAKTNDELCNNIADFNQEGYNARVKKHHEDLGSYEQGTATSQVTQLLQRIYGN